MSDSWLSRCLVTAREQLKSDVKIVEPVGGGDVAEAFRLARPDGTSVFMKTHRSPPAHFFSTEATGLEWLRRTNTVDIPAVLGVSDEPGLLLIEWIDIGGSRVGEDARLGQAMAALHRKAGSGFGRPDGMTTGALALPNDMYKSWSDCIANNRLLPLAKIARDRGSMPARSITGLEVLAGKLDQLGVPEEPPALLHGDLWAGNRVVDQSGTSWLIDPAAYYGHREADLAMMRLFGGFEESCYRAYDAAWPLAPGFESRIALHQIPPLVVHAIKFGGGYGSSASRAINQYL